MKLFTPERNELIEVTGIAPCEDGLMISGTIMGAMPMKAVLTPEELRRGFKFASPGLIFALVRMLFRRAPRTVRP